MPARAFVGLGSNLAHPRRQIAKAIQRLAATQRVRVIAASPNYVTAPIGGPPQADYVNAVVMLYTSLAPRALLARLHAIERMQQLRDATTDPKFDYFKKHLELQMQAASAWIAKGEGKNDEAMDLLRRAADAEDILGKHPVSPGALVPAREQLGSLLLDLKQPKEAQQEFEAALKIYPARFRGLYGAATAAEQNGDKESAQRYYAKLAEQTVKADDSRSELAQVRANRRLE